MEIKCDPSVITGLWEASFVSSGRLCVLHGFIRAQAHLRKVIQLRSPLGEMLFCVQKRVGGSERVLAERNLYGFTRITIHHAQNKPTCLTENRIKS